MLTRYKVLFSFGAIVLTCFDLVSKRFRRQVACGFFFERFCVRLIFIIFKEGDWCFAFVLKTKTQVFYYLTTTLRGKSWLLIGPLTSTEQPVMRCVKHGNDPFLETITHLRAKSSFSWWLATFKWLDNALNRNDGTIMWPLRPGWQKS